MIKHPFNKTWYDQFDNVAKKTLAKYLLGKGHEVNDVKEDYNVDVVSTKEDYTYFNEAEVKRAWKGDWPTDWAEIRISAQSVGQSPFHARLTSASLK